MQRRAIFQAIDGERDHQDQKWGSLDDRQLSLGDWLLVLEMELQEAKLAWCKGTTGGHSALHELRQVAAVAVAALEQHGCPERGE